MLSPKHLFDQGLDHSTPFQLWIGLYFDLSNLIIFGCRVYFHVPTKQHMKLNDKSLLYIFIGYAKTSGILGY